MDNLKVIVLELTSVVILLFGVILGYWNVGNTLFFICFEILLFIVIALINSFFPHSKSQPGPMLFGGMFIMAGIFFPSMFIAVSTGDFTYSPDRMDNEAARFIMTSTKSLWPIMIFTAVSSVFKIISISKDQKDNVLVEQLFFQIFSTIGLFILTAIFAFAFYETFKIGVLIAMISARILLEIYLYREIFGIQLKQLNK